MGIMSRWLNGPAQHSLDRRAAAAGQPTGRKAKSIMLGYKFRGLTDVNRRRDRRVVVSMPATVNRKPVLLKDISLGGLAFISDVKRFKVGKDVLIEIDVPEEGRVKIGACIVRKRGEHEYGVAFTGLSADAFRLIEHLETGHSRRLAPAYC